MIDIIAAPPLLTVQDIGRPGYRHVGVPLSGALDRWSLEVANTLCGNAPGVAALEWVDGGGELRFLRDACIALAGADADVMLDGIPVSTHTTLYVATGSSLTIGAMHGGRIVYVAVRGGVDVPPVLRSASTYLNAQMGGWRGRALKRDTRVIVGAPPRGEPDPPQGFECPERLRDPVPPDDAEVVRAVAGPQRNRCNPRTEQRLLESALVVTRHADRMGYRLEFADAPLHEAAVPAAVLPSEPGVPGAIQLPPGGQPIVLMPDGPTVGGYPKPLVVCTADLARVAQRRTGDRFRLAELPVAEAQRLYRRRMVAIHTLAEMLKDARYSGGP